MNCVMSGLLHAARHSHIAEFNIQVFDLVLGGIDLSCFFKSYHDVDGLCIWPPSKNSLLAGKECEGAAGGVCRRCSTARKCLPGFARSPSQHKSSQSQPDLGSG